MTPAYRYRFHGIDVASDFDFGLPETASSREPDLFIERRPAAAPSLSEALWRSDGAFADGSPHVALHHCGSAIAAVVAPVGVFVFGANAIHAFLKKGGAPAEPFLLGRIFGFWMELTGRPALHGACIDIDGRAIGLLGHSGAGKSTLAAAFLARGRALLADDLLPLTNEAQPPLIEPGIPLTKLWPDSGRHFWPNYHSFVKVHAQHEKRKIPIRSGELFATKSRPLAALYVLARGPASLQTGQVEALTPAKALLSLTALRAAAEALEILDPQGAGLRILARVLERVPVRRLRYGSRLEQLNDIAAMLERDAPMTPAPMAATLDEPATG